MRNFEVQAIFSATIPIQTVFSFKRMVWQTIFLYICGVAAAFNNT